MIWIIILKQRGSFSITTLILSSALSANDQGGITKTKIMQEVMLNYKRVSHYLLNLSNEGLMECNLGTRKYKITAKGMKILELSEELANYISPVKSMITRYESLFLNEEQSLHFDIFATKNERNGA